ncbi:MAG: hypothetical protein AB1700_17730, partial [Bacillota bacterium]
GSAFYDADLRDVEEPFTDAYVEVVARWEGSGAVPYLPEAVFDAGGAALRVRFSKLWFSHWTEDPGEALHCVENNYLHLIGASSCSQATGYTESSGNTSHVFVEKIATLSDPGGPFHAYCQEVTDHEIVHQWDVNPCACDYHDARDAWCVASSNCSTGGLDYDVGCLMNMECATPPNGNPDQLLDGVNRLCTRDILFGQSDPGCSGVSCPDGSTRSASAGEGALRTMPDPR